MRLTAFILLLFISACQTRKVTAAFRFPAEWEDQESIWLGWSADSSIQQVQLQMAKALHGKVGLTILSRSDSLQQVAVRQLAESGIDTSGLKTYIHYILNVFIRDAGPRFLKNELAIADFAWNNYGYPLSFQNYQYSEERGVIDNDWQGQMTGRLFHLI